MAKIRIEINVCPNGHDFYCIATENRRLTPAKCCGSWKTLRYWMVDADELIEDIKKANCDTIKGMNDAEFDAMREKARKNRSKVYA
jgi:hypothetical protein